SVFFFIFFYLYVYHRYLLSFPTRRSSDLNFLPLLQHGIQVQIDLEPFSTLHQNFFLYTNANDQHLHLPLFPQLTESCHLYDNGRSEEHTSELQSRENLVCRLLLEKKKIKK